MNRSRPAGLAVAILLGLSLQAHGFEAEATITNGKDLANLPVFVTISSLLGNGIDFTQLGPSGFHIYDGSAQPLSPCAPVALS
ncbi:hypothetical protein LCGC14_1948370 [marine sediment metagenome]|uniref:Uncharacterized protein n=1 Tax=marine sediment metagenome TaxID=412755 RepID=A0A0F9HWH8_9ZZZZ